MLVYIQVLALTGRSSNSGISAGTVPELDPHYVDLSSMRLVSGVSSLKMNNWYFSCLWLILSLCLHSSSWTIDASPVLFGLTTKDAAYISALSSVSTGGSGSPTVLLPNGYRWIRAISNDTIVGMQGDVSDCEELFSTLAVQNQMHMLDYGGRSLGCRSIAQLCQSIISKRLRSRNRLDVRVLVAGCEQPERTDASTEVKDICQSVGISGGTKQIIEQKSVNSGSGKLFWLDDIGSLQEVQYAAHGADTPFLLALLDHELNRGRWRGRGRKINKSVIDPMDLDTAAPMKNTNKKEEGRTKESALDVEAVIQTCWRQLRVRSNRRIGTGAAAAAATTTAAASNSFDQLIVCINSSGVWINS